MTGHCWFAAFKAVLVNIYMVKIPKRIKKNALSSISVADDCIFCFLGSSVFRILPQCILEIIFGELFYIFGEHVDRGVRTYQ